MVFRVTDDPRPRAVFYSILNPVTSLCPLKTASVALWLGVSHKNERPGFGPRFLRGTFATSSRDMPVTKFKIGTPARFLAFQGQRWDWLARCQYTMTGLDSKFDPQLPSQCGNMYNRLSRSVPDIH